MTGSTQALVIAATIGSGVVAGVFFAFSAFVMQGLNRVAPREAVAAMQGINQTAVTPLFMLAFLGTALLCAALVVRGLLSFSEGWAKLALAAGALYLAGSVGVTLALNVPLNDRLERVDAAGAGAGAGWAAFSAPWIAFNHVRTIAAVLAFALLVAALAGD